MLEYVQIIYLNISLSDGYEIHRTSQRVRTHEQPYWRPNSGVVPSRAQLEYASGFAKT
jgi:hypothetical protein